MYIYYIFTKNVKQICIKMNKHTIPEVQQLCSHEKQCGRRCSSTTRWSSSIHGRRAAPGTSPSSWGWRRTRRPVGMLLSSCHWMLSQWCELLRTFPPQKHLLMLRTPFFSPFLSFFSLLLCFAYSLLLVCVTFDASSIYRLDLGFKTSWAWILLFFY